MNATTTKLFEPRPEFRCFLSDPPWPERGAGKSKRGADRHYPVEAVRDIPDVIRSSGLHTPAADAHHWMWATDNYLADALWVLHALGWRYVRTAVWVKAREPSLTTITDAMKVGRGGLLSMLDIAHNIVDALKPQIGLGQYLRGSHELLLFATRGKGQAPEVRTDDRSQPSVFFGRRTKHSRKPESSYRLVEAVSHGPRVEFFARSGRPGWTSWGNEMAS